MFKWREYRRSGKKFITKVASALIAKYLEKVIIQPNKSTGIIINCTCNNHSNSAHEQLFKIHQSCACCNKNKVSTIIILQDEKEMLTRIYFHLLTIK